MKFREVQVQDVLDVQWGDTKTTKSSYVENGYLAYSATGPDGFLSKFDYDCDGVVLSAIGANCGSTFFATNKWSCIKNTIRILPRSTEIDLKFFYFMTKSPNFWPLRGSAQPFISQTDIREMTITIPDLASQRTIGEIIYSLELAIEMNGRVARSLEEIAQTIFKSWFIDFDPVKAKMAGEKPVGMDDATAALFPDSMEESEFGSIPRGWHYGKIAELANLKGGKQLSRDEFEVDGIFPVFGGAGIMGWTNKSNAEGFLITLGRVGANCGQFFCHRGKVWVNNNATLVEQRTGISGEWLFLRLNAFDIESIKKGAAQPFVSNSDLAESLVLIPPSVLIEIFTEAVRPLFLLRELLARQSGSLISLRSSLLPRLISGELQIPEEMLGV